MADTKSGWSDAGQTSSPARGELPGYDSGSGAGFAIPDGLGMYNAATSGRAPDGGARLAGLTKPQLQNDAGASLALGARRVCAASHVPHSRVQ